jgi:predicted GTPase
MLMADVAIINKVDSAPPENVEKVRKNITANNPRARILMAESKVTAEDPGRIEGKRVLVVEDGPTLTHGEMAYGAGVIAARRFGASELVDPRPYLTGSLQAVFQSYPGIGTLLPAMGYSPRQVKDLENTINHTECDLVLVATPIDLTKLIEVDKPTVRIRYEYKDAGDPTLEAVLKEHLM